MTNQVRHDPPFVMPPPTKAREPLNLGELLAFATTLQTAGHHGADSHMDRAIEIAASIDGAVSGDLTRYLADPLLDADPEDVAARVRQAASDASVARDTAVRGVQNQFTDQLVHELVAAIHGESDRIILAMRPRFAQALARVQQAADLGITSTTTAEEIVESGNAKTTAAYKALPAAVRELDEIADLRDKLTAYCDVGPWQFKAAAWLLEGASLSQLEGFLGHDDVVVTRVVSDPFRRTVREVQHRTGGAWLARISDGYRLTVNTSDQAHRVVATAQAAEDTGSIHPHIDESEAN